MDFCLYRKPRVFQGSQQSKSQVTIGYWCGRAATVEVHAGFRWASSVWGPPKLNTKRHVDAIQVTNEAPSTAHGTKPGWGNEMILD